MGANLTGDRGQGTGDRSHTPTYNVWSVKESMKKAAVKNVVESMPGEIDLKALFRRLYVLDEINKGEESLTAEGAIPHNEVARRFQVDGARSDRGPVR
jgi:hypothetical protein